MFMDIWNDMCFYIKNKGKNASEHDFQIIVESFFEKIGWSQRKREIITQKTIQVGATGSVKPDIIVKNNDQILFVIELKRPNIRMSDQNAEQIISYMRLLKSNFGILLGETLQIYYDLPNGNSPPVRIKEILFNENSNEGIEFIKLLSKNEYSFEKIQKYCEDILADKEKKENAQEYINTLCSAGGEEIVINLLKEKLSTKYSEEVITSIINEIGIHISRKGKIISPGPIPPPDSNELNRNKAIEMCRDHGFNLHGKVTFASKNKTVPSHWANPNIEFIKDDWWLLLNDYIHHNLNVFYILENSINDNQIKLRNDKQYKIDFQIKYENELFEDSRSGIQFIKWFKETIFY